MAHPALARTHQLLITRDATDFYETRVRPASVRLHEKTAAIRRKISGRFPKRLLETLCGPVNGAPAPWLVHPLST